MDQWPQHPSEPRFSYAAPFPGQAHRFMLSNEVEPEDCQRRMDCAVEWLTNMFAPDKRGVALWSRHGSCLIKIRSDDMALHFRLRFC